MASCITNEKPGRRVFFGAMITEGIVTLIWAAAGMAFYGGVGPLNEVIQLHSNNAASRYLYDCRHKYLYYDRS